LYNKGTVYVSLFIYPCLPMFGKKKKKNDEITTLPTNNAAVHTMQDDINSLNGTSQEAPQEMTPAKNNPFGDVQQPAGAPFPEESQVSEPLSAAAVAQQALTKEQASPEEEIINNETIASPSADTDNPPKNPTNSAPPVTEESFNEQSPSDMSTRNSTPAPLDTSNPFAAASSTPPAMAQTPESTPINPAPEASSDSVATKAQDLAATNPMPPAEKPAPMPDGSPFGTAGTSVTANPFPQAPTETTTPTLENEISKIQKEYGEIQNGDDAPQSKRSSCMSYIFIILIVLIIAGGGYYYWMSQSPDANNSLVEIGKDTYNDLINGESDSATDTTENQGTAEEYSETLPHYILLDTQSETAIEDFSSEIQTITANMMSQKPLGAISFIVTDESGAPLSFDRFALITGITLSPDVLAQIDESFLLYSFYANSIIRFGISAQTISPESTFNAMKSTEPTLVSDLTPLFAGEIPEVTTPTFSDGTYNETAVRYANLNTGETLSIDYAVYSGDLVIGTSKGTIRSIIDTL